jgi:hypothetical protein
MVQNPGTTNFEATIGICAECGALVGVPANFTEMGERPLIRHCAHTSARVVPASENPRKVINASLQKHAGW